MSDQRFYAGVNGNLPGRPLTPRQSAVHGLLRQGKTNKQIARDVGISESSVKVHLASMFVRLGVRNRVQAALKEVA